jgi:hypothetical protein
LSDQTFDSTNQDPEDPTPRPKGTSTHDSPPRPEHTSSRQEKKRNSRTRSTDRPNKKTKDVNVPAAGANNPSMNGQVVIDVDIEDPNNPFVPHDAQEVIELFDDILSIHTATFIPSDTDSVSTKGQDVIYLLGDQPQDVIELLDADINSDSDPVNDTNPPGPATPAELSTSYGTPANDSTSYYNISI